MKIRVSIEGIACQHCADAVESAAKPVAGVRSVTVSVEEKVAEIDFDEATVATEGITAAIESHDRSPAPPFKVLEVSVP